MPAKTKEELKLENLLKKANRKIDKLKVKKLKKKTKKQLKKELWALISPIIRNKSAKCYTCDKPLPIFADRSAGHLFSKGGHPATAFDLDNLRVQGDCCNLYKSGNCAVYSFRLIEEIGIERFNALALRAGQAKRWTTLELEALIAKYKDSLAI